MPLVTKITSVIPGLNTIIYFIDGSSKLKVTIWIKDLQHVLTTFHFSSQRSNLIDILCVIKCLLVW